VSTLSRPARRTNYPKLDPNPAPRRRESDLSPEDLEFRATIRRHLQAEEASVAGDAAPAGAALVRDIRAQADVYRKRAGDAAELVTRALDDLAKECEILKGRTAQEILDRRRAWDDLALERLHEEAADDGRGWDSEALWATGVEGPTDTAGNHMTY